MLIKVFRIFLAHMVKIGSDLSEKSEACEDDSKAGKLFQ